MSKPELRGLAEDLAPTTADLAQLTNASLTLLPQIDRTALCARDTVLPTGDLVIRDQFDTGTANYKEFWWTMVGLAGESQNFDGNGSMVRFAPGGGSQAVALGSANSPTGQLDRRRVARRSSAPSRSTPASARRTTRASRCHKSKIPDVNGSWAAIGPSENGPVKMAIRKHWLDFLAIIGLIVISGAVAVYILDNQRLKLPGWVPVVGKDFFVVKAEMSTAQAVTPGQGQTVNIAGVQVGEISKVELKQGKAVITLRMEPRYGRVYQDATVLLRPKTGLKDMVAELEPGHASAGAPEGRRRHPRQPDAARRQPRRDPRVARRRHARLPDRAAQRRRRGAARQRPASWPTRCAASSRRRATAARSSPRSPSAARTSSA